MKPVIEVPTVTLPDCSAGGLHDPDASGEPCCALGAVHWV